MELLLIIGFITGIAMISFTLGYLFAANKYSEWIRQEIKTMKKEKFEKLLFEALEKFYEDVTKYQQEINNENNN